MNFTTSSPRRIEKVSSDSVAVSFDLLSNLTYMAVLSIGGLPRAQVLEQCSRQRFKTAVFFEYIYLLAQRMGFEYTRALQLVSEKARAANVKSLLLRFAASISSGASEGEFVVEETRVETERYGNEYERSVENLRKWTEAYAAILVSVTLVMVVSLVSTMMGSIGQGFVVLMAFTLLLITSIGVYLIYKVAPVEQKTYDSPHGIPRDRRMARLMLLTLVPGVVMAILLASQLGSSTGSAAAFLVIGVSLLPAGYYAWKDDRSVTKLDVDLPTFLRSVGNVAGSMGVTLTEGLRRIDMASMGAIGPHTNLLHHRLDAQLATRACWEKFREETGSELVNRTTHMLVDGSELGGRPDQVGQICSDYALKVTQLRARRQLIASTFTFLAVPMHATMVFILVFVLAIVASFNTKLSEASTEIVNKATGDVQIPAGLEVPPGISIPKGAGDLAAGLDIFSPQDITLTSYMIIFVVITLTVANSVAPKFAAGGSNLTIASFLSIMCIVSGVIIGIVPVLTAKLFAI